LEFAGHEEGLFDENGFERGVHFESAGRGPASGREKGHT
jgi:hypothetical protein